MLKKKIFLSCSFDQKDSDVVGFFRSIFRGIDVQLVNFDKGFLGTPPEMARSLIEDSNGLVAIVTRRDEIEPGVFSMPLAVDQEISMAFGLQKPILLFVENGVDKLGFIGAYATYLRFDRKSLTSPAFLESAIASIMNFRNEINTNETQLKNDGNIKSDLSPTPSRHDNSEPYAESTESGIDNIYSNELQQREKPQFGVNRPDPGSVPPKPDDSEPYANSPKYGINDNAPTWTDVPLKEPGDDWLGRAAFAHYLFDLIKNSMNCQKCNGDGCELCNRTGLATDTNHMLLYGPWGSGKSTLLNFLGADLKKDGNWLVVEFNAWRNQHIHPPWWSLLDCIFQEAKEELTLLNKLREYWWRLNTGRTQYLITILIFLWILLLIAVPLIMNKMIDLSSFAITGNWMTLAGYADVISKVVLTISTFYVAILTMNRSLLLSSARAAQYYTELTSDPMGEIKRRFEKLVDRVKPKHIAVFIDDLDRCQSSFVVELLEGIQTLFHQAPVVFVVVADRRWINASYEQIYDKLNDRVKEPGKPLGTLFLEKVFRFSISMPGITEGLTQRYWSYLLQVKQDEMKTEIANAQIEAREAVSKTKSEEEIRELVDSKRDRSFVEQRAVREEAAVQLANRKIMARLEHALSPYAKFLEPNPRSMKHLVNAYNANRVLAILSEVEIDLHQLVIWTILSLRWPMLAEYLEKYPDMLEHISQEPINAPDELKMLFNSKEIQNLIIGDPPLKSDTVRKCTNLHS